MFSLDSRNQRWAVVFGLWQIMLKREMQGTQFLFRPDVAVQTRRRVPDVNSPTRLTTGSRVYVSPGSPGTRIARFEYGGLRLQEAAVPLRAKQ
jgi:hypothetical protein